MKFGSWILRLGLFAILGQGLCPALAGAKSVLRVAAASDLRFALPELDQAFTKKHPQVEISPVFGASGNLLAQIQQGAPFDLFLSADLERPQKLSEGHLIEGDPFTYSKGHLVLWVPKDSTLDLSAGLKIFENDNVHKIAVANPEHAPYGRMAMTLIGLQKDSEKIRKKLVIGEDVAQAAQWVENHAADVGLIAQSLALSKPLIQAGRFQTLGTDDHPLSQGGVILKKSAQKKWAQEFRDFLLSADGQQILKKFGLGLETPTE